MSDTDKITVTLILAIVVTVFQYWLISSWIL